MTRSMARRLSRYTARFLASILFFLAPGLDAHRAAAQVVTGRVSSVPTAPLTGLPQVSPTGAVFSATPNLALPSAAAPLALTAPVVPGANAVVSAAGAAPIEIAAAVKAAAPALQAVASAKSGAGDVSSAGHELIGALTGEQVAARSAAASAVAGSFGSDLNTLSAASEAPAPQGGDKVPAAAAPKVKKVESAFSYKIQRSILKMVAAATGALFTLPQAGPALTKKLVARAADKLVVISDYDDTLSEFSKELSAEMVEAIRAVRAAGKHFVVISDRSDEKRPGSTQQTVFESLSVLPADLRAGMYVAANSGGRIYRYNEKGEPVKVYEAPALTDAQKETLKEVAAAVKARLSEAGAEQHSGDGKNPAESHNPYGYALMLKVGSPESAVIGAADIMSEELAKRGWLVDVKPRFAKDPKNPPYVSMSIVTKATPSAWIAKALGVTADQIAITGDSMYAPKKAKSENSLTRLGRTLSGSDIPAMGNETDRNMERGLPGALALGVGLTADPTMADGWALDGKGPEVTLAVLKSVASKKVGLKSAYAMLERAHENKLAAIPGVISATIEDTSFYYGGNLNDSEGKTATIVFESVVAYQKAKADGLIPETLPAIEGVKDVAKYQVKPVVEKKALAASYKELEAAHLRTLKAIPGVVSATIEDTSFYYGGNLNDSEGKTATIVFESATALQKAKDEGLIPASLPAIEGVKDVAKYQVKPVVEKKALAVSYAELEAAHLRTLKAIPGVVSAKIEDKEAIVTFESVAAYQKAKAGGLIPETLPAIEGVKDVAKYQVKPVVEKKALAASYKELEAAHLRTLKAIPGVVSATIEDTSFYYGGNLNDSEGKTATIVFESATALQKAKDEGLIPSSLPAIDGVRDVAKYQVKTEVREGDVPSAQQPTQGASGGVSSAFVPRRLLSNPVETYPQAYKAAIDAGAALGLAAADVKFVRATASMPVGPDGKHWHYSFTAKTKDGQTALIYVDFDRFLGGQQDFKTSTLVGNYFVPEMGVIRALEPVYFGNLGRPMASPDAALDLVRAQLPYFQARASLELYLQEDKATGEQDLWYRFYDDKGAVATANLRTGVVREIVRPGLSYAIEPNELYALALEKITETATKSGLGADKIRLIAAVHEERRFNGAWIGDEWRFHFSVNGLQYTVPARHTMITEGMMDAFEPKLSEARVSSLVEGIPAADFASAVTVKPEAALKLSDRAVGRLSLVERGGDLWYSVQDPRGTEIISVNARTGDALPGDLRDEGASWRSFLIGVGLFGVVAAIYYVIYWAMTNAPAAQVPNPGGWQGPIPSIEEIFGALGAGAMIGGLRKAKKPKVSDAEIESAAKSVAASKGGVWSQTEYNMAYYNTMENLRAKGATLEQLARFQKLCDEAPVLGRGFNPWSGD